MKKDIPLNGASPMKPNQGSSARKKKDSYWFYNYYDFERLAIKHTTI
jgi:hypothetical protein